MQLLKDFKKQEGEKSGNKFISMGEYGGFSALGSPKTMPTSGFSSARTPMDEDKQKRIDSKIERYKADLEAVRNMTAKRKTVSKGSKTSR